MLSQEEKKIILEVEGGADVFGYLEAIILREIKERHPEYLDICKPIGKYSGIEKMPHFGVMPTKKGIAAARRKNKK